ncbi:protein transporter Sec31 [Streptomyces sp. NPDC093591]|uniref:protein transporter Sec31 n=1 Tax=Streptomyces sp. NPDC093591 TaxID=3366044 RepID=UPI00381FC4B6
MKTRKIERTRLVPHTVDGETEMVLDRELIEVPAPPRDWDQLVRTAVTVGAIVLVTASLVWTTASIGDLLSAVTISVVAYAAAIAFDASWIMCMGVEWLLRYDPARAKAAQKAGRWALAVSMGAVFAHGYVFGEWVIGVVGALVSGLAKGGWSMAMRVHARPLDDRTQQWVSKRRAAVDGQLAMIPIRRELQRGQAQVDAERRSLGSAEANGSADPETSGSPEPLPEDPDPKVSTLRPGRVTTQEAVRNAWDSGIRDPEAVLRTVRNATGKPVPQSSVDRYLRALRVGA